jgi:hypothetical protein
VIDPADRLLLAEARHALSVPFRDPVRVGGVLVPRKLARQIERSLARLSVAERRFRRKAWTVLACALAGLWIALGAVVWMVAL